jgi:hypothetical protein
LIDGWATQAVLDRIHTMIAHATGGSLILASFTTLTREEGNAIIILVSPSVRCIDGCTMGHVACPTRLGCVRRHPASDACFMLCPSWFRRWCAAQKSSFSAIGLRLTSWATHTTCGSTSLHTSPLSPTRSPRAEMTALPKVDIKCTAPSPRPTVNGDTVCSIFLARTTVRERKLDHCLTLRHPINSTFGLLGSSVGSGGGA